MKRTGKKEPKRTFDAQEHQLLFMALLQEARALKGEIERVNGQIRTRARNVEEASKTKVIPFPTKH